MKLFPPRISISFLRWSIPPDPSHWAVIVSIISTSYQMCIRDSPEFHLSHRRDWEFGVVCLIEKIPKRVIPVSLSFRRERFLWWRYPVTLEYLRSLSCAHRARLGETTVGHCASFLSSASKSRACTPRPLTHRVWREYFLSGIEATRSRNSLILDSCSAVIIILQRRYRAAHHRPALCAPPRRLRFWKQCWGSLCKPVDCRLHILCRRRVCVGLIGMKHGFLVALG